MAGQTNNKTKLPVTATGYQFQTESELREVKWLISIGTFKSLDEYGEGIQTTLRKLRDEKARASRRKAA